MGKIVANNNSKGQNVNLTVQNFIEQNFSFQTEFCLLQKLLFKHPIVFRVLF